MTTRGEEDAAYGVALGHTIRAARAEQKTTQQQLAEQAGSTRQYISDIERLGRLPTVATLRHIAAGLGLTPAELLAAAERRPTAPGTAIADDASAFSATKTVRGT